MPSAIASSPAKELDSFQVEIERTLERHAHLPRRLIRVEAHADRVVLHGSVKTWYQKQLAQEALRRVEGVSEIENRLEVTWA